TTQDGSHRVAAAAAAIVATPSTEAVVNTATDRSATVMLMIDQAVTPAAASSRCGAPKSPGTARANAAPTGTSAATDSAAASGMERGRASSAASTVATATPLTTNNPSTSPVRIRCATDSAEAARIRPISATAAA